MSAVRVKEKPEDSQEKSLIIVVGKNVSNKSTVRNLIKRRIRAIFREFIKGSRNDYTVIVEPKAKDLDFWELKEKIEKQIN